MPIGLAEVGAGLGGLGALASGASSLFGGGSQKVERDMTLDAYSIWDMEKKWQEYDRNLRKGIRLRVNDAKKAGLHPLYALGANPQIPGASIIPGQSSRGSTRKNAIRGVGEGLQGVGDAALKYARMKQIEAETNLIDEQRKASIAARTAITADSTKISAAERPPPNLVEEVPARITRHAAREPHRTAGVGPGLTKVMTGKGFHMWAPAEPFEDNPELLMKAFILNQRDGWKTNIEFMKRYGRKVLKHLNFKPTRRSHGWR